MTATDLEFPGFTWADAYNAQLLDHSEGRTTNNGPAMRSIYRIADDTVKIEVERDTYTFQSHAAAYVLAADRTWTHLLSEDSASWHRSSHTHEELIPVRDRLGERAATVLGA